MRTGCLRPMSRLNVSHAGVCEAWMPGQDNVRLSFHNKSSPDFRVIIIIIYTNFWIKCKPFFCMVSNVLLVSYQEEFYRCPIMKLYFVSLGNYVIPSVVVFTFEVKEGDLHEYVVSEVFSLN